MAGQTPDHDDEVAAIAAISLALAGLDDVDARRRVLSYVQARYLPGDVASSPRPVGLSSTPSPSVVAGPQQREIAGIARLDDAGNLRLTIRDLKARSALDAAVRLAHIAILAYEQLAAQPLSSRKGLTPLLKQWRIYDGNTRTRLARERGIVRDGDNLSLDAHARLDAERYIQDVLNPDVQGQWKPR